MKNAYKGIQVNIRGVAIMNDDPTSVQYLYGKIESEALQKIANAIYKRFIDAGKLWLIEKKNKHFRHLLWKFQTNAGKKECCLFIISLLLGLAKREFDRDTVKLHMTLINASQGNNDEDDDTKNKKIHTRKTFDARHILENYSQYEFGLEHISEIFIAIMQSKADDGFYKCTSSIQFW